MKILPESPPQWLLLQLPRAHGYLSRPGKLGCGVSLLTGLHGLWVIVASRIRKIRTDLCRGWRSGKDSPDPGVLGLLKHAMTYIFLQLTFVSGFQLGLPVRSCILRVAAPLPSTPAPRTDNAFPASSILLPRPPFPPRHPQRGLLRGPPIFPSCSHASHQPSRERLGCDRQGEPPPKREESSGGRRVTEFNLGVC